MAGASRLLSFHLLHSHGRHKPGSEVTVQVAGEALGCPEDQAGNDRKLDRDYPLVHVLPWATVREASLETAAELADLGACPANTLGTIFPPPQGWLVPCNFLLADKESQNLVPFQNLHSKKALLLRTAVLVFQRPETFFLNFDLFSGEV